MSNKRNKGGDTRMRELAVEIRNEQGLHTKPVTLIVKKVRSYNSELIVEKLDKWGKCEEAVKGDEMLGLLSMAAEKGTRLLLKADGEDEEELLRELYTLIEVEKFGEE